MLLMGLLLFSACKKDDDPVTCADWASQLNDELNAVIAAATTYGSDPTPANCQAYKNAYQDYLDAAEGYVDCVPTADREQLQQDIDAAQAELDQLTC